MTKAYNLVQEQAEREDLWFYSKIASECVLQRALRELHDAVENDYRRSKDDD